jgi:hypothetical protein
MKRGKTFLSSSRKIRGKRLPAKEPAPDLNLQKLRDELSHCPGGF